VEVQLDNLLLEVNASYFEKIEDVDLVGGDLSYKALSLLINRYNQASLIRFHE
jgi:hypothetical protein